MNEFKLKGLFVKADLKELSNGTAFVEALISQSKEYKGEVTTKTYPVSSFGEAKKDLLGFKPGDEVVIEGSIRSSTWAKDPSRHFINLTALNVEKLNDASTSNDSEEIIADIPF